MGFSEIIDITPFALTTLLLALLTGLIGYLLLDVYRNYGLASQTGWGRYIGRLFTEKKVVLGVLAVTSFLLLIVRPSVNHTASIISGTASDKNCAVYMFGRFEGDMLFTWEHSKLDYCFFPEKEVEDKMREFKQKHSGKLSLTFY